MRWDRGLTILAEHRGCTVVAGIVVLLDQISKDVAATLLSGSRPLSFGPLSLHLTQNEGAALGVWAALPEGLRLPLIVALSLLTLLVFLPFVSSHLRPGAGREVALGLIVSGALGNLIDRLWHGHVVDFISLSPVIGHLSPVFNVADLALLCGTGLTLFNLRRGALGADAAAIAPIFGGPP